MQQSTSQLYIDIFRFAGSMNERGVRHPGERPFHMGIILGKTNSRIYILNSLSFVQVSFRIGNRTSAGDGWGKEELIRRSSGIQRSCRVSARSEELGGGAEQ
jgi:hypothetical protein